MTKALINTYNIATEYRRHFTNALIFGCMLAVLIYVFNVYRIIGNTVTLQKVQAQSVTMESDVQKLDSKYLELSSQITPDTLAAHGFTAGKVSAYIPRNASLGRVAIGGHEL
jgi:hypothetical protein